MTDYISCAGDIVRDQRPLKKADQKYAGQIQRVMDVPLKDASVIRLVYLFPFRLL